MKNKKTKIAIFLTVLIVGGYFFYHSNLFPAAIVNWHFISQKTVDEYYQLGFRYLNNIAITYGTDTKTLETNNSKKELERAVLEKLIENDLIYFEVKKIAGNDLEKIANQKIENALKNADIQQAINTIFDTSLKNYTEKELKPQAYREILEGRMDLNNEQFDSWFEKAKNDAKVFIFIPGYSWDGKNVKIK